MTKRAATEAALGDLHAKVAKVMSDALDVYDKAQENFIKAVEENEGAIELDVPVVNPALLSVMTKFLSDNKITCVPEESEGMGALEEKLKRRREKRAERNVLQFPATGTE